MKQVVHFNAEVIKGVYNVVNDVVGRNEFMILEIGYKFIAGNTAIAVPMFYTTIKQRITLASVVFNQKDIEIKYKVFKQNEEYLKVAAKFAREFRTRRAAVYVATAHRHPGRFSFSSIDLAPKNSIIHRSSYAKNYLQHDFVFYAENKNNIEVIDVIGFVVNIDPKRGINNYEPTEVELYKEKLLDPDIDPEVYNKRNYIIGGEYI